ncbi:trypsin-like peptidase domain-containing protein [Streptomyces sp. GbtcB7]|uniref:trypsin-like peptidase domain-containing protein n=1 Tax=Streptomyces sp. GbtcB7 TaxID=2824752 RepID=UPI001C307CDA|nr:trypsin-like peptidase domain-containing protein [Streptomyces sp. GbtcB7]
MNEGKPTKAKWWSRPRPVPPGVGEVGPVEDISGPEADRDSDANHHSDGDHQSERDYQSDGDYELDRPATATAPTGVAGAVGAVGAASPYVAPAGPGAGSGVGGGDFELERPAVALQGSAPDAEAVGGPSDPVPASRAPVAAVPVRQAPEDRPRPLHDPDPYSTPPYGEPGPWAPAPPVQHPAATPAHGTAMPPGPPPLPAPAPLPAPYPSNPHPAAPAPWQNYDPWAAPGPLQQNGAAVETKTQRRKRARKALVLGAVALALVSGGVGGAVGAYLERNGGVGDVTLPQAAKEAPGRPTDSVAGIAARALPSVVTLHVRGSGEADTGTGFVLDTRGHILTNNHVVEPAGSGGEITVTFSGGESAKATVVGRDSGYDLAVVKVSGVGGLRPMALGNSDSVQVGDPVIAIGAPFDLANTVTSGIISAKERPITAGGEKGDGSDVSYVDALQTDAPINPGNSGGPLLDTRARVIGINSAIRSADGGTDLQGGQAGSIGLGFAIPVNQARRVAEELINTGRATHPVIGVMLDMDYTGDGARVGTKGGGAPVTAGGPGAKAGIKAGDVITEVDGERVHSGEELIVKTRAHRPGDRLRLTLRRGGSQRTVTLVLGSASGG